jgi:hypothetical protein
MLDDRPLLLLDDQLSDVQPSDLKLLYVQALDPATLHSECPDRQGAYRHCSRRARTHRQSAEARPPQPCGHPREGHLRPEGGRPFRLAVRLFFIVLSFPTPLEKTPGANPFHHKHDATRPSPARTS